MNYCNLCGTDHESTACSTRKVSIRTCNHDPLKHQLRCGGCVDKSLSQYALLLAERDKQIAALQERERTLIGRLQVHGDMETDKEEAL